jgi:preprotein translocase subunit SecE
MAKSATVDRDDKQGTQPVKVANKAANKIATQGNAVPGTQITGLYTRTVDFLRDVRGEMRKVVTPSREEVRSTTTVVIITVFAFAAYFYVIDAVLYRTVQTMLHWLGSVQ